MKNKQKKLKFQARKIKHTFTSRRLTMYGGLSPIMKFLDRIGLPHELDEIFATKYHHATKFSITQLMLSVILASMAGVGRLLGIANFTRDPLVQAIIRLPRALNKDVISRWFKRLGERGARMLEHSNGCRMRQQLEKLELKEAILDADSTVKTVYGHQQGAAKGYNPQKKGAKSYHPLLVFITRYKLLIHSWFRTGSAYTSNGIIEFLKQTAEYLPAKLKILFRADSGFFSGELIDYLESICWSYLIKVKFKGLNTLLQNQKWDILPTHPECEVCEFVYQIKGWAKARVFKAIRRIKEYELREYFGIVERIPVYEYACYVTDLNLDVWSVNKKYCERANCENWIEQVKNHLLAGTTLTNDFWANDILWQLGVLAYNLSVMMRLRHQKLHQQEHQTFRDWFIKIPGVLKGRRHNEELCLYQYYTSQCQWQKFADQLAA